MNATLFFTNLVWASAVVLVAAMVCATVIWFYKSGHG